MWHMLEEKRIPLLWRTARERVHSRVIFIFHPQHTPESRNSLVCFLHKILFPFFYHFNPFVLGHSWLMVKKSIKKKKKKCIMYYDFMNFFFCKQNYWDLCTVTIRMYTFSLQKCAGSKCFAFQSTKDSTGNTKCNAEVAYRRRKKQNWIKERLSVRIQYYMYHIL